MKNNKLVGICPYATAQKVLSGKWSIYILHLLTEDSPIRFNELYRRMPEEMSHATLSRQLNCLEENGLIVRTEFYEIPSRVEYSLADQGKKFKIVLDALAIWGNGYLENDKKEGRKQ